MAGSRSAALSVNIVADASKAVGAFDDAAKAGVKMAELIGKSADRLEAELKQTEAIAASLARALGPEMAAKLGQSKIDDYARQMAKAGVSLESVEADAEELGRQLARLDDITVRSARSMSDEMDKFSRTTDNSRAVMANFSGNAIAELPGVASAFGPLNTAIGQFTEYAADGNISMSGFLKFAGPIAALAGGFAILNSVLEENRKVAELTQASIDRYRGAYETARTEGTSAARALAAEWRELGKVETQVLLRRTTDYTGFGADAFYNPLATKVAADSTAKTTRDITRDLAALGVTIEQFAQLTLANEQQIATWADSMIAAGADADTLAIVLDGVASEHENAAAAAEQDALFTKVFGDGVQMATQLLNPYAEKLREVESGLWGMNEAQASLIELQTGQRANVENYTLSLAELGTVLDDPNTAINEQAVALEEAFAAGKDIAENYADQQAGLAGLAGTTFTANDALQAQIDSLSVLSWTLDPSSPLRRNLAGYITQLEQQILLNVIIANQQLAGQPGRISLGGDRAQEYRAIVAAGAAGVPVLSIPGANLIPGLVPTLPTYGPSSVGGDRAQELGGMNINIIMPAGADGDSVVRALQQYQRENGAIPITTTTTVVP